MEYYSGPGLPKCPEDSPTDQWLLAPMGPKTRRRKHYFEVGPTWVLSGQKTPQQAMNGNSPHLGLRKNTSRPGWERQRRLGRRAYPIGQKGILISGKN